MVIGMVIGAKIGAGALKGSFFAKFQAATDMEQAERLYQTASSLASQAAEPFLSSCLHTLTFMLIEQPLAEIAGKVLLHVAGAFLPLPRPQDLSQNFWMQFSMLTVQVYNIVAEQIAIHRSEAAANRGENSIEEPQTEDLPSNSYQEEECSREADYQHTGQSNTVELQGIIDTQESNALQKATEINNYDIFDSFQSHLKNAEIAKFPPGTDSAQVIQLYGQELQNSGGISPENPESKSQFSITNIARDLNQKLYDEKVMDPSQFAHLDLENHNNGNHYDVYPIDESTCADYHIIDVNTGEEVASLSREEVQQCKATIIDPGKNKKSPLPLDKRIDDSLTTSDHNTYLYSKDFDQSTFDSNQQFINDLKTKLEKSLTPSTFDAFNKKTSGVFDFGDDLKIFAITGDLNLKLTQNYLDLIRINDPEINVADHKFTYQFSDGSYFSFASYNVMGSESSSHAEDIAINDFFDACINKQNSISKQLIIQISENGGILNPNLLVDHISCFDCIMEMDQVNWLFDPQNHNPYATELREHFVEVINDEIVKVPGLNTIDSLNIKMNICSGPLGQSHMFDIEKIGIAAETYAGKISPVIYKQYFGDNYYNIYHDEWY